jgi:hypothetical protein
MAFSAEGSEFWNKRNVRGTVSTGRQFNEEAINKLIYDAMASDKGLASLASGENLSGGFNSSTKTLLAQDFMTKLIGELAVLSSPEVKETQETTRNRGRSFTGKGGSVICTELVRQGKLPVPLYMAGREYTESLPILTYIGYISWALPIAKWLRKNPEKAKFFAPVAISYYRLISRRSVFESHDTELLGGLVKYVGEPLCNLLGTILVWKAGYGRRQFT